MLSSPLRKLFLKLIILFNLLISPLISISQNFVDIPTITSKINYTIVSDNYGIALMGGMDNYFSTNSGSTWAEFDNSVGTTLENQESIDAAIVNSNVICMIVKDATAYTYSIARTDDQGLTWTLLNTVFSYIQEFKAIQANGNNLVLTAKGGIYNSIDGGETWTFVSLSSGAEISNFVDYNIGSSNWYIGSYMDDILVSNDLGVTWTPLGFASSSDDIVSSSNLNNQLLLTQDASFGTRLITVDGNDIFIDTVEVPIELLMSWPKLKDANYLPSGDIISCNNDMFYRIDTSNWAVFVLDYPTTWGVVTTNLSLGSSFGIASKWWDPVSTGSTYLLNYNSTPTMYILGSFYFLNELTTCAGDDIIALPYTPISDSLKWYVNGNYITDNNLLNFPTPQVSASYTVKLEVYYNGIMKTESQVMNFPPQQTPNTYTHQVNTIACYDQPLHVYMHMSGNTGQTGVIIEYGDQVVAGPYIPSNNIINLYTTPITTQDTLVIITFNTAPCDSSADTLYIPMILGPNMLDFEILPHDSAICIGDNQLIELLNTNTQYNYDFSTTYSMTYYAGPWNTQFNGNEPDTLEISLPGLNSWVNNSNIPESYYPYTFMYLNIEVEDPTSGCVSLPVLDTIDIFRSKAYYDYHSRSFLQNDTIHLSNALITNNRLWSSDELSSNYIFNTSDTVPLVIPDTTGIFGLKLRNEPIPGCVDSIIKYVYISEPTINTDTACTITSSSLYGRVFKVEIDQFGNRYEIGTSEPQTNDIVPVYVLRKFSMNGDLLWEKKGPDSGWAWGDFYGAVIEALDFDCEGNPICAAWIGGEWSYSDDFFNFDPPSNENHQWCIVFKINKIDGSLIWSTRINDILGIGLSPSSYWKITDLAVDKNNGYVHLATYKKWDLDLITLDDSGDFIGKADFNMGGWSQQTFIPASFQVPTGSNYDSHLSFWSPQLEVLSTGIVVGVGHYENSTIPNYPQLDLGSAGIGTFIFKYHPDNGIYDVDRLAQLGTTQWTQWSTTKIIPPLFTIDNNDDITVIGHIQNGNTPVDIEIVDSTITLSSGIVMFNLDTSYNLNWLTLGTHGLVTDFAYMKKTGSYLISYNSKDNSSFGQDTKYIMVGEDVPTQIEYTSVPSYASPPPLDYQNQNDIFLAKFNELGSPISIKKYTDTTILEYGNLVNAKIGASPCEDFYLTLNNRYPTLQSYFEVDGIVVSIDSIKTFHYQEDCSNTCHYINTPDSVFTCSNGQTVEINICDYYNVSDITFDLYLNGNIESTNNFETFLNGSFSIDLPNSGEYMLIFSSPSVDTTIITNHFTTPATYIFNDSICDGETLSIDASEPFYNYDWMSGSYTGSTIELSSNDYIIGLNTIDINISDGVCSYSDSISFYIDGCASVGTLDNISYSVYPNPNDGCFYIKISSVSTDAIAELYSINGLLLEAHNFNDAQIVNFRTNLSSGVYFVDLKINGITNREKIVVK